MYNFHTHLAATHPYLSNPWGWLLLARPVAYFYESPHGCGAADVLAGGARHRHTGDLVAVDPGAGRLRWRMIARFDWRAAAILVAFLAGYVTWIYDESQTVPGCSPASDCHRTMFLFYLLPDVPFMVLALTMALAMVIGRRTASQLRRIVGSLGRGDLSDRRPVELQLLLSGALRAEHHLPAVA